MSLLMDALKRAETSKQEAARAAAAQGKPAPAADGLSLEPLSAAHGSTGALPDLAAHIDALDADLAATAPAAPVRQPAAAAAEPTLAPNPAPQPQPNLEALNQAAARNAFAAKQAAETPSKRPMWIALGILGLAFAGIGI
jgi:hypothetical protein